MHLQHQFWSKYKFFAFHDIYKYLDRKMFSSKSLFSGFPGQKRPISKFFHYLGPKKGDFQVPVTMKHEPCSNKSMDGQLAGANRLDVQHSITHAVRITSQRLCIPNLVIVAQHFGPSPIPISKKGFYRGGRYTTEGLNGILL